MNRIGTFGMLTILAVLAVAAPAMAVIAGVASAPVVHQTESLLEELVAPLGIVTLALVAGTVSLGVFRRIKPKVMFQWHKIIAFAALIAALVHATMAILSGD